MSVQFQCPSCMRNLQFSMGDSAFTDCPYCKSKIIVPSSTVHQEETEQQKPTEYALVEQKNLKLAEIQAELNAGRKINAIKIFRETFNTGLSESKDAVEALERGEHIDISKSALEQVYSVSHNQPQQMTNQTQPQITPAKIIQILLTWALIGVSLILFYWFLGD